MGEESELRGKGPWSSLAWKEVINQLRVEVAKYIAKLIVLVILIAAVYPATWVLKSALGIFAIEDHLKAIEESITSKDDTISNVRYDYYFPPFFSERQMLRDLGFDKTLEEIILEPPETYKQTYENTVRTIRETEGASDKIALAIESARYMMRSPIRKVFNFVAAKDTEVILVYELICSSPAGYFLQHLIPYSIHINATDVTPFRKWQGTIRLKWGQHLQHADSIVKTRSKHDMYAQTLTLNIVKYREDDDDEKQEASLKRWVNGDIQHCAFEAAIFVRDELSSFEEKGLIPYIESYFHRKPSQQEATK